MIFVGSPYSSPIAGAEETRFRRAQAFILHMHKTQDLACYSPVVYWHPLSKLGGLPGDAAYWLKANMDMLRFAEVMFVLCLSGWRESKGLQIERNTAKMIGLDVIYYDNDFLRIDPEVIAMGDKNAADKKRGN